MAPPPQDPFIALWQTAPKPDTQRLLRDLELSDRLHRRTNLSVFAILCGVTLLFIFEEATGRVATHGALSFLWILGLVFGMVLRRRARCHGVDALRLDTVRLLEFMIARAKRDLLIARCLYAGVPCGAAAGFLAMKLAGIGGPGAAGVSANLHAIQTGAGIAALIAMTSTGAVLARSRRHQVSELSEKLRNIRTEV
ncbi:MAG: hypothetical protein JWP63_6289 [Candidatus Solibacter sp.]|nr:hypothetical protein [Candidatus Solibacter sp.]